MHLPHWHERLLLKAHQVQMLQRRGLRGAWFLSDGEGVGLGVDLRSAAQQKGLVECCPGVMEFRI